MRRSRIGLLLALTLHAAAGALIACRGAAPAPTPLPPAPTPLPATPTPSAQDAYRSQGGGEPRTTGYWLLWNGCASDNRAETARANGGRAAGWVLLDDLLADPGVLVGERQVETCEQGVRLLQRQDVAGADRSADLAYNLAAQLLAAQLNLAAGAEYCPASDGAVQAGQLFLLQLGFDGSGAVLGTSGASQDRARAERLTEELARYNAGELCR